MKREDPSKHTGECVGGGRRDERPDGEKELDRVGNLFKGWG